MTYQLFGPLDIRNQFHDDQIYKKPLSFITQANRDRPPKNRNNQRNDSKQTNNSEKSQPDGKNNKPQVQTIQRSKSLLHKYSSKELKSMDASGRFVPSESKAPDSNVSKFLAFRQRQAVKDGPNGNVNENGQNMTEGGYEHKRSLSSVGQDSVKKYGGQGNGNSNNPAANGLVRNKSDVNNNPHFRNRNRNKQHTDGTRNNQMHQGNQPQNNNRRRQNLGQGQNQNPNSKRMNHVSSHINGHMLQAHSAHNHTQFMPSDITATQSLCNIDVMASHAVNIQQHSADFNQILQSSTNDVGKIPNLYIPPHRHNPYAKSAVPGGHSPHGFVPTGVVHGQVQSAQHGHAHGHGHVMGGHQNHGRGHSGQGQGQNHGQNNHRSRSQKGKSMNNLNKINNNDTDTSNTTNNNQKNKNYSNSETRTKPQHNKNKGGPYLQREREGQSNNEGNRKSNNNNKNSQNNSNNKPQNNNYKNNQNRSGSRGAGLSRNKKREEN